MATAAARMCVSWTKACTELSLDSSLHAINLHCNNISKITSIDHIWNLRHLDLSSNQISQIEGLNTLTKLCTLNLSCNLITRVEGLEALVNLIRLNLSYNHISDLSGYRAIILQTLPHPRILDCKNIFGEPVSLEEINSSHLQCFEGLLDNLVSSDSPLNISEDEVVDNMSAPPIDVLPPLEEFTSAPEENVLTSLLSACSAEPEKNNHENNFQNEMKLQKLDDQILQLFNETNNSLIDNVPEKDLRPKRDTDITSESDYGNRKKCSRKVSRRTKIPYYTRTIQSIKHHNKNNGAFVSCNRKMRQPYLRDLYVRSSLVNCNNLREVDEQKNGMIKVDKSASSDSTYRVWFRKLRKLNLRFKNKVLES